MRKGKVTLTLMTNLSAYASEGIIECHPTITDLQFVSNDL